jgi:hypothetical protein
MDPKALSADFRDFLKFLNDHGVEYLLIGRHAVAYPHRVVSEFDGLPVNVIGLAHLKNSKKASARNKDLADLDNLP